MNCNKYIELINLQLDSRLNSEDYAALSKHMDKCPACRSYYNEISAIKARMAQMEEEVPESLHSSIMAKIPDVVQVKKPFYKSGYFGIAVAACIMAVAVAGFMPRGVGMKKAVMMDAESAMRASDDEDYSNGEAYSGLMDTSPEDIPDEPTASAPEGTTDVATEVQYVLIGKGEIPQELLLMEGTAVEGNEYAIYPAPDKMASVLETLYKAGFTDADEYSLSKFAYKQLASGKNMIIVVLE